jgi:hypothetical protein
MIKFHCEHCDKKLGVPDNYAGKRVRCSQCKNTIVVPHPEPEHVEEPEFEAFDTEENADPWSDDMFQNQADPQNQQRQPAYQDLGQDDDESESSPYKKCPSCNYSSGRSAAICIHCGYNFSTGQQQDVVVEKPKSPFSAGSRKSSSDTTKKVATVVSAIIGFAIGFYVVRGFMGSGSMGGSSIILVMGWGMLIIGGIWFLVVAFQEGVLWGLACMVVPFANIIFFFTHFEESWKPAALYLAGCFVVFIGFFAFGFSAMEHLEDAWELTEEDIVEYIQDEDYMFGVGCWKVDQTGRWDDYDDDYDGDFANSLTSYKSGWLKPSARRKDLIDEEIAYVEEVVASWTEDEKREYLIEKHDAEMEEWGLNDEDDQDDENGDEEYEDP